MDDTLPKKSAETKATGRRYSNFDEFLKTEFSSDASNAVRKLAGETRMTRLLAASRAKAGLTQEKMGEMMQPTRTQSAISKLEAGKDEDLTLADIGEYSRVLNERIGVVFGPKLSHVEAIKSHALEMRRHMLALTKLANTDGEMEKEIQAFFGEAFFNILSILATCQQAMPEKDLIEFKVEIIEPAGLSKPAAKKEQPRQTVFV